MDEFALPSAVIGTAEQVLARRRIPRATYRLQFEHGFTFRDAQALVPYLDHLGISDCYTSPLLRGNSKGDNVYAICDQNLLDPALGSQQDFDAFISALKDHGMGLLLDIVPNHMGIVEPCNALWLDVLENGPSSLYASYFDIDWHPVKPELENKVLLPFLEDQYGVVLESGKLRLAYDNGGFFLQCGGMQLPIAPITYGSILGYQLDSLIEKLGKDNENSQEFQSILTAVSHLPPRTDPSPEAVAERDREKEVIRRRIAALHEASPEIRAAVERAIAAFNGDVGDPRSFDLMDGLLDAQAYRLAYWRVAAEEINYRRFFDVNELAAVRVELPDVFQATHRLIFDLLAQGKVTGLRVDHPDGLWDPRAYFHQVQETYLQRKLEAQPGQQSLSEDTGRHLMSWLQKRIHRAPASSADWPLYVVAEKVLSEGETLPADWAVYGTTGYDFLNALNRLFVDGAKRRAFDRIYSRFTGGGHSFGDVVNGAKKTIMLVSLASEVASLSHKLERITERNRRYRDFTLNSVALAVTEIIACLPVYRTYIVGATEQVARRDQTYVEAAVADARRRNPGAEQSIFSFIQDVLTLRNLHEFRPEDRAEVTDFVMGFQQVTGPMMAKAFEDTALYVYNRLVSLNEVGGSPERFGASVSLFHRQNEARWRRWPHSLLATSTHDTKRSEDVRARINVLSEIPKEWEAALERWSRLNASKKALVDGEPAPDRNDEYLLYQTLVGAWPWHIPTAEGLADFRRRIVGYMLKATKEAKVHTSWLNPDERYDAAVEHFVSRLLADTAEDDFLEDFVPFQRRVTYYGQFNSLAQILLKLTAPGVPDIYQGNELWDFSLVDPDNRRPVDYRTRRSMLAALEGRVSRSGEDLTMLAKELLDGVTDGRIKLYLTYQVLNHRRAHPRLFSEGSYRTLEAIGEKRRHVCAYARVLGAERVLVVVPRLVVGLTQGHEQPPLGARVWKDTILALPRERTGRTYRNLLTGEMLSVERRDGAPGLPLATLLQCFPVALLERMPAKQAGRPRRTAATADATSVDRPATLSGESAARGAVE